MGSEISTGPSTMGDSGSITLQVGTSTNDVDGVNIADGTFRSQTHVNPEAYLVGVEGKACWFIFEK